MWGKALFIMILSLMASAPSTPGRYTAVSAQLCERDGGQPVHMDRKNPVHRIFRDCLQIIHDGSRFISVSGLIIRRKSEMVIYQGGFNIKDRIIAIILALALLLVFPTGVMAKTSETQVEGMPGEPLQGMGEPPQGGPGDNPPDGFPESMTPPDGMGEPPQGGPGGPGGNSPDGAPGDAPGGQQSRVANLVNDDGVNAVNITLTDDAVWNVTGTSLIASLSIEDDARVIVPEGITLTVNGVDYTDCTLTADRM